MVCGCVWAGVGVGLVGCGWVWVDVGVGGWVSNSALASCRAAVTVRIPPSLNEPPSHVLGGALGWEGWTLFLFQGIGSFNSWLQKY